MACAIHWAGAYHHTTMATMEPTEEQIDAFIDKANVDGICGGCLATCADVARLAYAAGADAELEACRQWVWTNWPCYVDEKGISRFGASGSELLMAARRPKPSIKQNALDALDSLLASSSCDDEAKYEQRYAILNALESLPDD